MAMWSEYNQGPRAMPTADTMATGVRLSQTPKQQNVPVADSVVDVGLTLLGQSKRLAVTAPFCRVVARGRGRAEKKATRAGNQCERMN